MAGTGGKRPGAGRKTNAAKAIAAGFIAPFFGLDVQENQWKSLLNSKDERIRLDTVKYLTDRMHGKARQSIEHSGDADNPLQFTVTRVQREK